MTTDTEVGAIIGLLGVLSGLVGQALFWGIFRGSVTERMKSHTKRMDKHELRLDGHDIAISRLDVQVARIERSCDINHGEGR